MAEQGGQASWADEIEEESLRSSVTSRLSCFSWSFLALVLVICGAIVANNLEDAALLPGFLIGPLVVLYFVYWRHCRNEIPIDLVLKNFAFGFVPGAFIVMIVELILTGVFFLLCFNDQIPQWVSKMSDKVQAEGGGRITESALNTTSSSPEDPLEALEQSMGIKITRTPGFYLFIFLLAYIVAAGTEETMKYCSPLRFRACRNSPSPYIYLVCTVASALGFSTIENVGYTFGGGGEGSRPDFSQRMVTAYSRAVVAIAAHSICGGIVGLGLSRRYILGHEVGYFGIILPAAFVHGSFDFLQLLLVSAPIDPAVQALSVIFVDAAILIFAAIYLWVGVRGLQLHRLREPELRGDRGDASEGDDEEKLLRNRAREQV